MKRSPSAAPVDFHAWKEAARAEALRAGFSLAGFASAEALGSAAERRWQRAIAADRFGDMEYLRRQSPRRTDPRDLMPEAESILVAAAGYYQGDHPEPLGEDLSTRGKVARYAWGRDYHEVMRARLGAVAEAIGRQAIERGYPQPVAWRAIADSAPLDERGFAARAGLGFIGKNTLLLHPKQGSWMVLGELLLSVPFPPDEPSEGTCGNCRKCLEACPTAAFPKPYELDAERCISYLTIERKAGAARRSEENLHGWAFGCDICQEVCPFNAKPMARLLPEFAMSEGIGAEVSESALAETPTGKGFLRRWGHTPLARRGLKGLLGNLRALARSGAPRR